MESLKKHLLMNSGSRSLGGNSETQSVFFVDSNQNAFPHQIQSCYEGIVEYLDAWKKFDGAGTHLIDSMHSVLKDTAYEKLGSETFNAFKSVYSSSNGIDPGGKLKEMEKLMTGLKACLDAGDKVEKNAVNNKIMCRCLLLFLKVQSDYHQMCSVTVSTLLTKLVHVHENHDLLQQMSLLDLIPHTDSPPPPGSRGKKNSTGSESPKTGRNSTFKNSLFSLFDRKPSPEDNTCAFYVDLNQSNTKLSNQSEPAPASHVVQNSQSDILVQLGLDPVKEDSSGEDGDLLKPESCEKEENTKPVLHDHLPGSAQKSASSHLATEDDLDLVINLLSGMGGGQGHMEPIPENQMHLSVPSLFTSRTPSPKDCSNEEMKMSKLPTHRRSDGCLDFHGVGNMGRGNTWPHRASLPTSSLGNNQVSYPDYSNFGANTLPRRYSHDLNVAGRLPPYAGALGSGHNLTGYQWGGYLDTKYSNRTWPLNSGGLSAHLGSDNTLNSSWSAIQDCDDMSDDSSCGDQFFAVGLDLAGAIDSKNCSSDDEGQKQKSPNDDRPHSAEDLLAERQTVNPWSPKQIWNQPGQAAVTVGAEELLSPDQQSNQSHRPVSMQWSDPLANRNMWSTPGLGNSQSMHGFGPLQ